MKRVKDKALIFITSTITGILIVINLNMGTVSTIFNMKTKEYKDAVEEKNTLHREISDIKEHNNELRAKLFSYNQSDQNHDRIIEDMKEQVKDYSYIAGRSEIYGSGIVITISDGDYDIEKETEYEVNRRTLHSQDAASVINELRNANAEAIAINGYRVLGDTSVECNWAFILFNDNEQTMEFEPFKFYAIGNPDELEAAILAEGSYINKLIIRKLNIDIEKRDEIIIPATARRLEPQFMERLN